MRIDQASKISAKAHRLAESGAVRYLPHARVYPVFGDTGSYFVIVDGSHAHCTCPNPNTCSHIDAVMLTRKREHQPATTVSLA